MSVCFLSAFWPTRYGTVTGQISAPQSWFEEHPNTTETYEALFRDCYPDFPKQWISVASKQLVVSHWSMQAGQRSVSAYLKVIMRHSLVVKIFTVEIVLSNPLP